MKNYSSLFLSILSGILLFAAWPMSPLTALIFIAWVPLLFLAEKHTERLRFFVFSFLSMFIWNAGTTWWIWNSTAAGAIGAIIANSFLMTIPLWGYHVFKNKFGDMIGYAGFIIFWLCFEYIHLNWQLSWPWLTLGNVFASSPEWVQWYEVTGTSGGSLWVLFVNVIVFQLLKNWKTAALKWKIEYSIIGLIFLAFPFFISSILLKAEAESKPALPNTTVIIVQPNVDPYNEKFAAGTTEEQVQRLISLSEEGLDANTRLVLWPETALPMAVLQDQVEQNFYYTPVFDFVKRHPGVTLVTGIETFKTYGTEKATNTARKSQGDGTYFDAFNASVAIKANEQLQFYNKSKLVPGVETLPDFLMWLADIFEHFGGTAGGYGKSKEPAVFKTTNNPYVSAPIICYESIYGEYVAEYVRKGATVLTILTNDAWWANTPGHRQHLNYARLRAIETRRWIARSANTGISAVIDSKGRLVETRQWAQRASMKFNIPALAEETFFVRHGDIISRIAIVLGAALLAMNLFMLAKKKLNKRKH
ncbi:MAG TPA: apolipoprotein N-acyltransferase [Segetibacter sp.]